MRSIRSLRPGCGRAQTKSFLSGENLDDERPERRQYGVGAASSSVAAVTAAEVGEENELTTSDPIENTVEADACVMGLIADGSALKLFVMHIGGILNDCAARNVLDWSRGYSIRSQDRDHLAIKLNHKSYFPHARANLEDKNARLKLGP